MTSSGWLDELVIVAMVGTGIGSAALLSADLIGRRSATAAHRDVHLFHLSMSVVMVVMITGLHVGAWSDVAAAAFVVPVAWFAARAVSPRSSARATTRLADVQHAVAALAMVVMAAAMAPAAPILGSGAQTSGDHVMAVAVPSSFIARTLVVVVMLCVLVDLSRARSGKHRRTVLVADVGMALAMGVMVLGPV